HSNTLAHPSVPTRRSSDLGMSIITSNEIDPGAAYVFVPDAFVFLNAAPSAQRGQDNTASASFNGVALRWINDYDTNYLRDRSVLSTYYGFDTVKDVVRHWNPDGSPAQEAVTDDEYFVRAVKVTLGGTSTYPEADSELAIATGVSAASGGEGEGE